MIEKNNQTTMISKREREGVCVCVKKTWLKKERVRLMVFLFFNSNFDNKGGVKFLFLVL